MNKAQLNQLRKGRIFEIMAAIESHTGKMLHEIDKDREWRVIQAIELGKLSVATNIMTKWIDEVRNW